MNILKKILIVLLAVIMGACNGSDTYSGCWKATDENTNNIDIEFYERELSIIESGLNKKMYAYYKHSVRREGLSVTYGISLGNG